MKNKKIVIIIIGLLLVSGILLFIGIITHKDNNQSKKKVPQTTKKSESPEKITEPYNNPLPAIREHYNNQYIMAKLEIPGLKIDSLVTRYTDNTFYLINNIYNQRDDIGVPFFDYRNTDLSKNPQINIYGHNTTNEAIINQLPFTKLQNYLNEDTFNNSKDIYLSIDEKQIKYQVIAVKIIPSTNNEHMKLLFKDSKDYLEHVSKLLENTTYQDNTEISKKDRILIMQVCNYNPPDSYLLIICKEKS